MTSTSNVTKTRQTAEIIVGLDDSAAAIAALHWATDYAARTGAFMRLVHAFELEPLEMYGVGSELRRSMVQDLRAGLSELARDTIDAAVPSAGWQLDIVEGSTGPVLVDAACDAHLLVLGTGTHTGVRRLLGSASHYCLSHAATPVVAVPNRVHGQPSERSHVSVETPVTTQSR